MLKVQKNTPTVVKTDEEAVQRYESHFDYLLNHNTFELTLLNGQTYYTFANIPFTEWQERLAQAKGVIQATEFLDKLIIEQLSILIIKTVKDVTTTVQVQYRKQREVIFESYRLVSEIIRHAEKKIVQDAARIIEKSRNNTESKRKYWRVLNETYYGLDIHPLMEYEVDELTRILYACEHYEDNPNYSILSWVLSSTAVIGGGAAIGYVLLQVI